MCFFSFTAMATINQLSEEILEEILLYIPKHEIPGITLVSKKFNDVISSSVKLMENFEVQWQKNKDLDMRPLLQSNRKYRRLSVIEVAGIKQNLDGFLNDHASTLTSIYFYDCSMTSTELQSILNRVAGQLKELNMCEVNFEVDGEVEAIKLKSLKQMEIMYGHGDGFVSIFPFFAGAQLEVLQYEDNYEMDELEMEEFSKFLIGQTKLKKISLTSNVTQKLFADEKFAKSCRFQCENLFLWINGPEHVEDTPADEVVYTNLIAFIKYQGASLATLTLGRFKITREMLRLLLSLQLHDLRLVSSDFTDTRKINVSNKSIKKIFISMLDLVDSETERVLCDILKSCKSVEKLRFSCVDVTFEMALVIAYEMKKLTRLNLYNCHFLPITFPRLSHIEVLSCETRDILRLIRVNRQLTSITVGESFIHSERFRRALDETEVHQVAYI
jgi:F-box domain